MMKFAAYDDLSIYAVAESADAAIAKARDDARDLEAKFEVAPITDELAAWIDVNGWDGMRRSFEVDRSTGYIVDTTNN